MSNSLLFITGGARSGKSSFAEKLARSHPGPVAYVATAMIYDDEMARRVERHKESRPSCWKTFEVRATLAESVCEAAQEHSCVLVDCLTVYLARFIPLDLPEDRPVGMDIVDAADATVRREISQVVETIRKTDADFIIVSNEVGDGLVPPYPAGRLFRDMVGRGNQLMAAEADFTYLVVAGMPLDLKALSVLQMPWEA